MKMEERSGEVVNGLVLKQQNETKSIPRTSLKVGIFSVIGKVFGGRQ
jgi:hypothetical protein